MNLKNLKIPLIILVFFIICKNGFTQESVPSQQEIKSIVDRGRQIADYERAAIRATDMLLASNPDKSKLGTYIAVFNNKICTVFFGKLTDKGFDFAYYYSCPDGQFEKMKPQGELKDMSKDIYYFAHALDLATKAIEPDRKFPRYNPSIFREQDGTITVYFLPGNTEADIVLLGGDFKVSVSNDGTQVLSKTKLHESTLKIPLKVAKDGEKLAGGFHTHVLSELPTETDVALIILNPVLAPHYITGKTWMTKIESDGKISVLGKTEEILKK